MTSEILTGFEVHEASGDEVQPLWIKLWPGRKNTPLVSTVRLNGQIDMSIREKYQPIFWKLTRCADSRALGCLSGHLTTEKQFRLRGLFIEADFRGRGLSRLLFDQATAHAKRQDVDLLWSLPRQGSFFAYQASGFFRCSKLLQEGMLYGPNQLAIKVVQQP